MGQLAVNFEQHLMRLEMQVQLKSWTVLSACDISDVSPMLYSVHKLCFFGHTFSIRISFKQRLLQTICADAGPMCKFVIPSKTNVELVFLKLLSGLQGQSVSSSILHISIVSCVCTLVALSDHSKNCCMCTS